MIIVKQQQTQQLNIFTAKEFVFILLMPGIPGMGACSPSPPPSTSELSFCVML